MNALYISGGFRFLRGRTGACPIKDKNQTPIPKTRTPLANKKSILTSLSLSKL